MKTKKRRVGVESTDSSTTLSEQDLLKVIKRFKLDLNSKSVHTSNLKYLLKEVSSHLDFLVADGTVDSYEPFGGYRYNYLLLNDINVDLLLKVKSYDCINDIINRLKSLTTSPANCPLAVNRCNDTNTTTTDPSTGGGSTITDKNTDNSREDAKLYLIKKRDLYSLSNEVILISFHRGGSEYKFKLFLTRSKIDINRAKERPNVHQYLMKKLDEVNGKYENISNTILLFKLFLRSYNQSYFHLNSSSTTTNSSSKLVGVTNFNGYTFNILLTHLCTINNYSHDVKVLVLFRNLINYLITTTNSSRSNNYHYLTATTLGSSPNNSTSGGGAPINYKAVGSSSTILNKEIKERLVTNDILTTHVNQFVTTTTNTDLGLFLDQFNINLLSHLNGHFNQLIYFLKVAHKILNSTSLTSNEKTFKLFLKRYQLAHFYEHLLFISTTTAGSGGGNSTTTISNGKEKLWELMYILKYAFKDRLSLAHYYHILEQYPIHTTTTTSNSEYEEGYLLYLTFNHNVQDFINLGPSFNTTTTTTSWESEFFKAFWTNNYQLVKNNNNIQYSVDLIRVATTTNRSSSNKGGATTTDKTSGRSGKEQLLLSNLNHNYNLLTLLYLLNNHINLKEFKTTHLSLNNTNVNYPFITQGHQELIKATNDFTDILTSLEFIPLKILNIKILSESYSYLNLYPTHTSTVHSPGTAEDQIVLLIKWESCNKWPRDSEALEKVVMSFLVQISRELRLVHGLDNYLVEDGIVVDYSSFTFRLLFTPVTTTTTTTTTKTSALEEEYLLLEECRNMVMKNVSSINCVRLLKIFFAKYLQLDCDPLIKRLSLEVYNEELNYIRSDSSTVQFIQSLTTTTIANSGSSNSNLLVKRLLKQYNDHLTTIHSLTTTGNNSGDAGVSISMMDNERLNQVLRLNEEYNIVINLKPTATVSGAGEGGGAFSNHKAVGSTSSHEYIKQLIIHLKNNKLFTLYYYNYKVLNYFKSKGTLSLNLNLDTLKFIPKINASHTYPQSAIVTNTHLTTSKGRGNKLIKELKGKMPDVIFIPNVILLLKSLINLSSKHLNNIII